jgi:hypothetical protein
MVSRPVETTVPDKGLSPKFAAQALDVKPPASAIPAQDGSQAGPPEIPNDLMLYCGPFEGLNDSAIVMGRVDSLIREESE